MSDDGHATVCATFSSRSQDTFEKLSSGDADFEGNSPAATREIYVLSMYFFPLASLGLEVGSICCHFKENDY